MSCFDAIFLGLVTTSAGIICFYYHGMPLRTSSACHINSVLTVLFVVECTMTTAFDLCVWCDDQHLRLVDQPSLPELLIRESVHLRIMRLFRLLRLRSTAQGAFHQAATRGTQSGRQGTYRPHVLFLLILYMTTLAGMDYLEPNSLHHRYHARCQLRQLSRAALSSLQVLTGTVLRTVRIELTRP